MTEYAGEVVYHTHPERPPAPPITVNVWTVDSLTHGPLILFQHVCWDGHSLIVDKQQLPPEFTVLELSPLSVIPGVQCGRCHMYGMWVRDAWVPLPLTPEE